MNSILFHACRDFEWPIAELLLQRRADVNQAGQQHARSKPRAGQEQGQEQARSRARSRPGAGQEQARSGSSKSET